MPPPAPPKSSAPSPAATVRPRWLRWVWRLLAWSVGLAAAGVAAAALGIAVALAMAYPNLPDISDLSDYRPILPLRVFSADGVLIGEFGTKLQTQNDRQWLTALTSYITTNGLSFAYWCWNPDSNDTGGILMDDWTTVNTDKQSIIQPALAK